MYKKINSSGVIMIIVVVIIMVMSIIGVNIISQSMSQTKTARTQALQVVIEELTAGAFW